MKQEKDTVRESNYDGIQEYDNDLPRWWLMLFYLTILYGVVYAIYAYGFRDDSEHELAKELAVLASARPTAAPSGQASDETLLAAMSDTSLVPKGKEIFSVRCAPCHGADGQGIVGPNLTDKYWIHGGHPSEIKRTIEEGVAAKGMIAWKGVIPESDIIAVIAFIRSIRDSNPNGAKAAEGTALD